MEANEYRTLFGAFPEASLEEFLKIVTSGISEENLNMLVPVDLSYHRYRTDNILTLEAFLCLSLVESDQWIWVRVEMDSLTGSVCENYYTKESYGKFSLPSLQACIDHYLTREA